MYDKLVTIIVPMYNIEQYITKCIESFKQVDKKYYADFEVIVVNDGSTDNSLQVVEDLITNSSCLNIRVVNKENGGHGSTINVGIKESKGKFFKVIDGDDWIDVPSFEKLLEELKGVDVDMVITNYTEQHIYNQTEKEIGFSEILDCNKIYEGIPLKRIPMHALTYKTSILKESRINISEKTFYVDMEYTLLPLQYVKSYVYIDLNVYQYFLGRKDQSMNLNVMKQKADHHNRVTKKILDYYEVIRFDKNLGPVVKNALTYLINKQCQLFIMNKNIEEASRLFSYAHKCHYRWKYDHSKKIVSLIYINSRFKNIFNLILKPLIKKQQKEWSEVDEY